MKVSATVRFTTIVLSVVAFAIGIIATGVAVANGQTPELPILSWVVCAPVLGLLLVVRAGAVRMGSLLIAIGVAGAVSALGAAIPTSPIYLDWLPLVVFSGLGWLAFLGLTMAALPLLFPNGFPTSPRWRPLLWLLAGLLVVGSFMAMFAPEVTAVCSDVDAAYAPCADWESSEKVVRFEDCIIDESESRECTVVLSNPLGVSWVPALEGSLMGDVAYALLLITALLSVVSLGARMRRGTRQERQQIKFLLTAVGLFVAVTLVEVVVVDVFGQRIPTFVEDLTDLVTWTAIPVAIFLAITRYRLYEIDRIISRTVSYALVIAIIALAVAVIATIVGAQFDEPVIVAATTLGVAAVFNPLRIRVRTVVDRRFNRSRYDTERVMSEFAGTLNDRLDPVGVVAGWTRVVVETMQPSAAGVWVRE